MAMVMTNERLGQLALMALEEKYFEDGLNLSANLRREVIARAKRLGVSENEACEFSIYMIERVSRRTIESLKRKNNGEG